MQKRHILQRTGTYYRPTDFWRETPACTDVQEMRCVLAVYFTHFGQEDEPVSYLWLEVSLRLRSTNLGRTFSVYGLTSGFSTVYTGTISLAICNVTASIKAVH